MILVFGRVDLVLLANGTSKRCDFWSREMVRSILQPIEWSSVELSFASQESEACLGLQRKNFVQVAETCARN